MLSSLVYVMRALELQQNVANACTIAFYQSSYGLIQAIGDRLHVGIVDI